MALGSFAEGTAQYEAALEVAPAHPAALLGAAESLAAAAGMHARQGALGAWVGGGPTKPLHGAQWQGAGANACSVVLACAPPAAGTAAIELARAAAHILRCTAKHGTLQAGAFVRVLYVSWHCGWQCSPAP